MTAAWLLLVPLGLVALCVVVLFIVFCLTFQVMRSILERFFRTEKSITIARRTESSRPRKAA